MTLEGPWAQNMQHLSHISSFLRAFCLSVLLFGIWFKFTFHVSAQSMLLWLCSQWGLPPAFLPSFPPMATSQRWVLMVLYIIGYHIIFLSPIEESVEQACEKKIKTWYGRLLRGIFPARKGGWKCWWIGWRSSVLLRLLFRQRLFFQFIDPRWFCDNWWIKWY